MHDDELRDDPLQPPELKALQALLRDEDPGRLLEERTVRALQREGLLAMTPRRSLARPLAWVAAAAIAFFTLGFAVGRGGDRGSDGVPSTSDASYRPTDVAPRGTAGDRDRRGGEPVVATAVDTTDASGARFVVWF